MRTITFLVLLSFLGIVNNRIEAQNDYLVNTSTSEKTNQTEEEQFISAYFPLEMLCKWTPGLKFMFIPDAKDMFIPILCSYETGRDADNGKLKHKIFEFTGTEEIEKETYIGKNYSTRFIFECEGEKYYHEIKNQRLDEICQSNPRASINGFVYLKDVDIAREQLIGKTIYTTMTTARIDDPNSYSGFREVPIPQYQKVKVTGIGVGNKAYPVKIIFEDPKGNSYYAEVAFSRTNSGMDVSDFQADKKMKYFANAFSFTSHNLETIENIKARYIGLPVYPKKTLEVKGNINLEGGNQDTRVHLLRYTSLIIKDIQLEKNGTLAILILEDNHGKTYQTEVDLKYNYIIKNENFIEDLFGFGDMRKKYPHITDENWKLIANGEVKEGMNTDECRLSLGRPIEVELKKDSRFETWFYYGKVLEFESGILLRFK